MDALERENQELRDALDEAHARMDAVSYRALGEKP